jgi:hypothetical protein
MKTAISIPARVFREAERVAKRLKLSRGELYRRALESFMSTLRDREVTASYDTAWAGGEAPTELHFRRKTARSALLAVAWKE